MLDMHLDFSLSTLHFRLAGLTNLWPSLVTVAMASPVIIVADLPSFDGENNDSDFQVLELCPSPADVSMRHSLKGEPLKGS